MFKKLKQLLLTFALCTTTIQLAYSIDIPSTADNGSELMVYENIETTTIKYFIELAKNVISKYKKNPEDVKNKIEAAKSESGICVISSCNGAPFFELLKFKLKNKQLLLKLDSVLLNVIAEIKAEDLQTLNLSNEESADAHNVLVDILGLIPDDIKASIKLNEKSSRSKNEKIQDIMQKIEPALNQLFEYNLGLKNSINGILNKAVEKHLSSALSEADIKELHTFITKKNGAFDIIVGKIDQIWEIVIKCLS